MNFNHTTCCESRHPVSTCPVPETTITSQTAKFNCRIQSGLFLTCILFLLAYYSTLLSPWYDTSTMFQSISSWQNRDSSTLRIRAGWLLILFGLLLTLLYARLSDNDHFFLKFCVYDFYDRTNKMFKPAISNLSASAFQKWWMGTSIFDNQYQRPTFSFRWGLRKMFWSYMFRTIRCAVQIRESVNYVLDGFEIWWGTNFNLFTIYGQYCFWSIFFHVLCSI